MADPLRPSSIIELTSNGVECAKWTVDKFDWAGGRSVFSFERFNYMVFESTILIRDLFFGTSRKFTLVDADNSIQLLRYAHLASNRGFLLYETAVDTRVSIVSIDLDADKYEFIGNSCLVFTHATEFGRSVFMDDLSQIDNYTLTVKTDDSLLGSKIHIFKVNRPLNNVCLQQVVSVPDYCQWFKILDRKIVFARFNPVDRIDRCYLDNFMTLDLSDNCSLTEIEDSGTCLQSRSPLNECVIYPCGIQGQWFGDRFFVLCNFMSGQETTVFFSVFSLSERRWSELRLNSPGFDQGYVKFNVDYNGVLNLLHHIEVHNEESRELSHTNVVLSRISLKIPEKFAKLSWFKARQLGLLDEKKLPYNFPFKSMLS